MTTVLEVFFVVLFFLIVFAYHEKLLGRVYTTCNRCGKQSSYTKTKTRGPYLYISQKCAACGQKRKSTHLGR